MLRKIGGSLMLLFLISVSVAVYSARHARKKAAELVADLRELQVGSSRIDKLEALSRKYSSYAVPGCKPPECTVAFVFDNRWLARLHLAKFAVLGAAVLYQDDQLREIGLNATCYGRQGGPPYIVVVRETLATEPWSAPPFYVGGTGSEVDRYSIDVHLTRAATPEQRSRAYAFNLYFLDHLGPCKDATDILPVP